MSTTRSVKMAKRYPYLNLGAYHLGKDEHQALVPDTLRVEVAVAHPSESWDRIKDDKEEQRYTIRIIEDRQTCREPGGRQTCPPERKKVYAMFISNFYPLYSDAATNFHPANCMTAACVLRRVAQSRAASASVTRSVIFYSLRSSSCLWLCLSAETEALASGNDRRCSVGDSRTS